MDSLLSNVAELKNLSLDDFYEYQQIVEDSLPVPGMIIGIVMLVMGLLLCLLGLKLVKFWSIWFGFWLGLISGLVVGVLLGVEIGQVLIIAVVVGIALGLLALFLGRFGMFIVCLVAGVSVGSIFIEVNPIVGLVIALVLGCAGAILAAVFRHPIVIIMTALQGGLLAGGALVNLLGNNRLFVKLAAGAILVIFGMTLQFMMRSREIGRKQTVKANKIKDKVSMESEVEAARSILDDEEEDED